MSERKKLEAAKKRLVSYLRKNGDTSRFDTMTEICKLLMERKESKRISEIKGIRKKKPFESKCKVVDLEKFVLENQHFPWMWELLSANPNISMLFIESHPEFKWDLKGISSNPNLTEAFVLKNRHNLDAWDIKKLSKNPGVTADFLYDLYNRFDPEFTRNPNISEKFILKHIVKILPPETYFMVYNSRISDRFVETHPELSWDPSTVTLKYLTSFLRKHRDKYTMDKISKNPNITEGFILEHLKKFENSRGILCANPALSPRFILGNFGLDGPALSLTNPNITESFVLEHQDKYQRKYFNCNYLNPEFIKLYSGTSAFIDLSKNLNVSVDYLMNHRASSIYLSSNPNLTPEFILSHPDGTMLRGLAVRWNWLQISGNLFSKHKWSLAWKNHRKCMEDEKKKQMELEEIGRNLQNIIADDLIDLATGYLE